MSKTNNLGDFLTDVANAIRTKKGTIEPINAQDFSSEIESIQTGIVPNGKIEITNTNETDVTDYAKAQVVDSDLTPDNIKKDINILGVVGTYEGSGGDTLKSLLDYTKSTNLMFYNNTNITDISPYVSFNTTSNVIDMTNMFNKCTKLTTVPLFDTSNVTSMRGMFGGCTKLTTVPLFDTSKVTDMSYMFSGCSSLTTVPLFDTSKVTDMSYMFSGCSSLTTVPLFDTSNVTSMYGMFYGCTNLTSVPLFDTSNVIDMNNMFNGCYNLKSILMYGMKVSFDISASTKFERSDLVTILNNLATVTSTKTLTMGSTNLAKLTDEDKAIATNKGWTLA